MFVPTASPAGVTPGTPLAEWVGTDGPELFAPWMFDGNGAAVILPADVIGFRARYWPEGARGIGELVEDDEGRPVFVPRKATPEEFRALVGYRVGRYKLAALDQSFRFLERAPLVVTAITRAAAERAGMYQEVTPTPAASTTPASSPSSDQMFGLLSHLLNLLGESHKQATTQNAQLVGSLAGVLNAAGESGTVQKSTALAAAAAGAPVTVQMMPPGASGAPNEMQRNGNAPGVVERGGYGEAAMSLIAPLFEKLGPVLAYGTARKFDLPEDYARSVAGMVHTTAQTVTHMLKTDGAEGAPSSAAATLAPRVGAELMAHVMRIQARSPTTIVRGCRR